MLHQTIKITVAIPFKHKMLSHRCLSVGLESQTVIQHKVNRETNQCLLDTLNTISFDKQI